MNWRTVKNKVMEKHPLAFINQSKFEDTTGMNRYLLFYFCGNRCDELADINDCIGVVLRFDKKRVLDNRAFIERFNKDHKVDGSIYKCRGKNLTEMYKKVLRKLNEIKWFDGELEW